MDKQVWLKTLKPGSVVLSAYPNWNEPLKPKTVDNIIFGASCQTGVSVLIDGDYIDSSWILPPMQET